MTKKGRKNTHTHTHTKGFSNYKIINNNLLVCCVAATYWGFKGMCDT